MQTRNLKSLTEEEKRFLKEMDTVVDMLYNMIVAQYPDTSWTRVAEIMGISPKTLDNLLYKYTTFHVL